MPLEVPCLAEIFLQQIPACHWMLDAGGVFVRLYGDPAPLFGKSAAQLTGQPYAEALGPELAETWSGRFGRTLAGEIVVLRERRGDPPGRFSSSRSAWGARCATPAARPAKPHLGRRRTGTALHRAGRAPGAGIPAQLRLHLPARHRRPESHRTGFAARPGPHGPGKRGPRHVRAGRRIQKLLETIVEQVREYSYELNPSTVERAGLRTALDRFPSRIRQRYTGVLRINVDPSLKIDSKIAVAMYHVALEAVENAVQHSSCSTIEIAVKSTRTGPRLEIRDNGKGFDPGDLRSGSRGLGLLTMEHYAAQAGMDLSSRAAERPEPSLCWSRRECPSEGDYDFYRRPGGRS